MTTKSESTFFFFGFFSYMISEGKTRLSFKYNAGWDDSGCPEPAGAATSADFPDAPGIDFCLFVLFVVLLSLMYGTPEMEFSDDEKQLEQLNPGCAKVKSVREIRCRILTICGPSITRGVTQQRISS